MATVAYTDGACSGNPGPGGWAWAIPGGAYASGAATHTTNQRMEIEAALEAARAIDGPLRIVSDSTYVVNCFRDRWWEGWLARNWVNKAKKPVANRDLWEPLIDLVRSRGDITFEWVKGHSGDPMNDLVDRLAVEAAETQKGRAGDEPPDQSLDLKTRHIHVGPLDQFHPTGKRLLGPDGEVAEEGRERILRGLALAEVLHHHVRQGKPPDGLRVRALRDRDLGPPVEDGAHALEFSNREVGVLAGEFEEQFHS